ncbi:MAG: DUF1428 domain-containing protein [Candidatus Diapherotrites archaeon]|nr:DUF1428 domain-containing protein [Candidatus Diapherotrites archaeon]
MSYVDGFVLAVPKNKINAYKKMAQEGGKAWKKHGALEYFECVGEDLNPKVPAEMKGKTFPQMAKTRKGETVVFSFIVYKSRAHRDAVNKKVMKEMNEKYKNDPKYRNMEMPFDMKRVVYGGFKAIVEL